VTAMTEGPEQRADAPETTAGESLQQSASPSNTTEHNSGVQSGIFSGIYNVYNWYAGSRKSPRTVIRHPRTLISTLFLSVVVCVAAYPSITYWNDNRTVGITSRIVLSNSRGLGDRGWATAHFDVPVARRYLRLTVLAVDSDPATGDCVSRTTLTATPSINGNLRTAVRDQPTGDPVFNFDLDLGSPASAANITVAVGIPDPACRVNLSISKAELRN
jgi:hypothetical protein